MLITVLSSHKDTCRRFKTNEEKYSQILQCHKSFVSAFQTKDKTCSHSSCKNLVSVFVAWSYSKHLFTLRRRLISSHSVGQGPTACHLSWRAVSYECIQPEAEVSAINKDTTGTVGKHRWSAVREAIWIFTLVLSWNSHRKSTKSL